MNPLNRDQLLAELDALRSPITSLSLRKHSRHDPIELWHPPIDHIEFVIAPRVDLDAEIARRLPSVQSLRIDGIRIREGMLAVLLARLDQLDSLAVRNCGLGESGAGQLLALVEPGTLRRLDLHDNDIAPQAAYDIVVKQPNLTHLGLSANTLGDGAITPLISFMEDVRMPIEVLDLTKTSVNERGAAAIANAELPHLRDLRLGNNMIGDPGAEALATSTLDLERLDLSKNWFHGKAASKIKNRYPTAALDVGEPGSPVLHYAPHVVVALLAMIVFVGFMDVDVATALAITTGLVILSLGAQSIIERKLPRRATQGQ